METRASYVVVGGFVMAVLLGMVSAALWLAQVQFRQEYDYYQTYFAGPVTGLGNGTVVRYNGIDVGRVAKLEFAPDDPKQVVVTMQLRPGITLHQDSVASMESQGLTGGSYVEIAGGTRESPPLPVHNQQPYPIIRSKPSTLQQVFDSTPELLARLVSISDRLTQLLSDENRQAIADTLANLRDTTAIFQRRAVDIDHLITDGAATMHNLSGSTRALEADLDQLQIVLVKAGAAGDQLDQTLASANGAAKRIDRLTGDLDDVLVGAKPELKDFANNGLAQITELIGETRLLVASLTRVSGELERRPTSLLFGDGREGYTPK